MKELDKLDTALMHRVNANPGCCIRDAIRPFLLEKSESVLRERVRALELRKRIRTTKTKREVLCYPDNETRIKKDPMLPASDGANSLPQEQDSGRIS